jgi:hypothetical protein
MSITVVVSDLIQEVRDLSDQNSSQFVTDAEITRYLDKSYRDMYIRIVQQNSNFFETTQTYTVNGAQDTYPLPTDFYKLCGIDLNTSADISITLSPINRNQRNINKNVFSVAWNNTPWRYRISAENIIFTPVPLTTATFTVWYIPDPTPITSTTQTLVLTPSTIVDYLVIDSAIKCLQKEESDTSNLLTDKQLMIENILQACATQDDSFPLRVTDMTTINGVSMYNPLFRS